MTLLLIKALLAPSLVVTASLTARRFGPAVGGLVAGIPMVAGPALLIFALEHGAAFAARAAAGTLLGMVGICSFLVVYGRLARMLGPVACLLAGWTGFAALVVVLGSVAADRYAALALGAAAIAATICLVPAPEAHGRARTRPPRWDLPLRAVGALALVLVIAGLAEALGPRVSGMLASFPILASVLVGFAHAQDGPEAALGLLRGLAWGLITFGVFCFALSAALPGAGIAGAFELALGAVAITQLLIWLSGSAPD